LDDNEDLEPTDMDDSDGDGGIIDDELEDGDDFYSSKVAGKSKEKKAFKKSLYQVAPKYPKWRANHEPFPRRFSIIMVWSIFLVTKSLFFKARFPW
jgi:hypothetical protein